jgi:hypothetical protein
MAGPGLLLGGNRVWKVSVIRSEIRSRAELKSLRFVFVSAPFTPTRYRAQTHLVQVDYVRVVDLDIGAIKTDNPFCPSPRVPFSAEPESDCSGWGFGTLSRPTICTLNRYDFVHSKCRFARLESFGQRVRATLRQAFLHSFEQMPLLPPCHPPRGPGRAN